MAYAYQVYIHLIKNTVKKKLYCDIILQFNYILLNGSKV